MTKKKAALSTREIAVFAMLGTVLFLSKLIMEWAPNIHILGMLIMVYTLVYRKKALIPLYVYVILLGIYYSFASWWIPYLYIWTVLWAVTMLLPKSMPRKIAVPVYMAVCTLHGLCFGILYAPAQALLFGLSFKGMLTWIAAGFPFDVIHALGNLAGSILIVPMAELLCKLERGIQKA